MDKKAFSVGFLHNYFSEKAYWHAKSPYERLLAIEKMRQIIYGYSPTAERLQRFFEVTQRS